MPMLDFHMSPTLQYIGIALLIFLYTILNINAAIQIGTCSHSHVFPH